MKTRIIVFAAIALMSRPASVLASWGLEVGRADPGDVASLASDWISFKMERARLDDYLSFRLTVERQKQLLGVAEDETIGQLFEDAQEYWLSRVMGPLQRIALNPASSCAEARFALSTMMGMQRQQQLVGLEESEAVNSVYKATEEMAALRCRDEALDECVATGRFVQIIDLMMSSERQVELLGRAGADLESWAEDALKQCAIYELHFVSRTKWSVIPTWPGKRPGEVETVRDGKVQIRFEIPAGGIKSIRALGEALKGETAGGNNPFFVSVKCRSVAPEIQWICSPGANSSPIEIRVNALDLRHREFYIDYVKDKVWLTESELSRERVVGEDKISFEFGGGEFALQSIYKLKNYTVPVPMPQQHENFYMAHRKDWIETESPFLKVENTKRGVYPAVFQFNYADEFNAPPGLSFTDSTEFELIHKPEPKPFRKVPEPIRRPLKPPADR